MDYYEKMIKIAPSMLSTDFGNLNTEIDRLKEAGADLLHLDIMDGVFVGNISFGFPIVEAIIHKSNLPVDIHLMITHALMYAPRFWALNPVKGSRITIHTKNCPDIMLSAQTLKNLSIPFGIAYNPEENLPYIDRLIEICNHFLVMSVHPGFGAQSFIKGSEQKVAEIKNLAQKSGRDISVAVDGGINFETGKMVINNGANELVVGSFLFKSQNYKKTISHFKSL